MIRSLEQRITAMERMISEIHALLLQGRKPAPPDADQWREAYAAAIDGNMAPLELCTRLTGGIVPKAETLYPDTDSSFRSCPRTTKGSGPGQALQDKQERVG